MKTVTVSPGTRLLFPAKLGNQWEYIRAKGAGLQYENGLSSSL